MPSVNPTPDRLDDRVTESLDRLLAGLSTRQQVGQLNQRLYGWRAVERRGGRWRLTEELTAELERWDGLGALYGLFRADPWSGRSWADGIGPDDRAEVAELVQQAVRSAGAAIPTLLVEEAPHGHQALGGTLLPTNLAQAAAWDPDLVAEGARAVAGELAASGVSIALVSGLDLLRDPRWGRAEECFGEDPGPAAELCRALVVGMQGEHRSRLGGDGVGVVLKHLAAQGEGVGGRNGQSAVIGERDLRELHLRAAEAGIAAGAVGVMAAYNDIDGVPCCAHSWLLQRWLREEQRFDGIVMADGGAVDRLTSLTGDVAAAGALALRSGVDLSLWDVGFTTLVETAERDEQVAAAVTTACRRVLSLKHRLGLLPATDAGPEPRPVRERVRLLSEARERTAAVSRRLAAAGLVLLSERPGSLPLPAAGPVVVVGPNAASSTALLGDYVPPLPDAEQVSVLDELRKRCGDRVVAPTESELPAALAEAAVVVAVLGGTSHRSYADAFADNGAAETTAADCGEGVDRADLHLPGDQDALLDRIRGLTDAPVVGVVVAGRPYVLTRAVEVCDALVWAGYPGPYGAGAIADVLLGVTRPAGALPFTLLRDAGAVPVRANDRHAPGVYADARDPVLFGYGHGIGAGVEVADLEVTVDSGSVEVTARIANPTDVGAEQVLIATATRSDGVTFPRRSEVLASRRVRLAAGETRTERWRLPSDAVFALDGPGPARSVIRLGGWQVGPIGPD